MLIATGYISGGPTPLSKGAKFFVDPVFEVPRESMRILSFEEGEPLRGLSAVVGQFGFIPLRSSDELRFYQRMGQETRPPWLVTVLEKPLLMAEEGVFLSEYETRRASDVVSRNGVALSRLDSISELSAV